MTIGKRCGMSICSIAEKDNIYYFINRSSKGLYTFNKETNEVKLRKIIPDIDSIDLYWMAIAVMECIWFIPTRSYEKIVIYNTESEEIELLPIPNYKDIYQKEVRPFEDCYIFNHEIILIPKCYQGILCIDSITKKMNIIETNDIDILASDKLENDIYMYCSNNKSVYTFDLLNKEIKREPDINIEEQYNNIIIRNNTIYFIPEKGNGCVMTYDINNDSYDKIQLPPNNICIYYSCLHDDNNMFLLPYGGNVIIALNFTTNEVSEIEISADAKELCWGKSKKIDESMLAVSESKETPMIILNDSRIEEFSIVPEKDYFLKELLMELHNKEDKA